MQCMMRAKCFCKFAVPGVACYSCHGQLSGSTVRCHMILWLQLHEGSGPLICHCADVWPAEGEGSGSLFGNFKAPPPGSSFGFGSAGGKPKDVEEGGEGEEGAEENGQELFGGPEVAPVVQLSEVPKQTGEEGENNVFAGEAAAGRCGVHWVLFFL